MSVEHLQSKKEIKINDKYILNIESKWEGEYSWDEVTLTDGINCLEVGSYYTAGVTYEREWLEYNENYVAILHQDLISGTITINSLVDLANFSKINDVPERVKECYNALKQTNSPITNFKHYLKKGQINKRTFILIENKPISGGRIEEVALKTILFRNVEATINIGENKPSEVKGYIGRYDYLGSQITFDKEGMKGWIEYNNQYVAFIDYNPLTNRRIVNRIFDIEAKCFLDNKNCDLEQIYNQNFTPEFIFRQPSKLPVKKLELKNNKSKLML